MELGGSPRETGARPRGIPGLCNHQFAYPIQFWSHSSRPPRPASPFARSSRSSSFPTSLFFCYYLFLSLSICTVSTSDFSPLLWVCQFLQVFLHFCFARNSSSFVFISQFLSYIYIFFFQILIVTKNCSILQKWIRKINKFRFRHDFIFKVELTNYRLG